MRKMIHRQTELCSNFDVQRLCSLDNEVIVGETPPLIAQTARFLFIRSGEATIRMQGKEYPLRERSIIMIFPWEITEVLPPEKTLSYTIVKYNFDMLNYFAKNQAFWSEEQAGMFSMLEQHHVIQCNPKQWKQIMQLLTMLEEEIGIESVRISGQSDPLTRISCCNILMQLVIVMYRVCCSIQQISKEEHEKIELLRYIYLHLESKITVEQLANIFYISQSSVRRYIKSLTGMSFNELLNVMRISKTSNYLLYTDLTLEELADILGFTDAAHISKVFQSRVGMKVNEYRKTYRNIQQMCNISETRTDYAVVNYILRNYQHDIKLQTVADLHNISPQDLNRILVYQVGSNFTDFLNKVRINAACKLLLESDCSIADVAIRVGYNNIKTFNRNFVNSKLMTPSAFRRNVSLELVEE